MEFKYVAKDKKGTGNVNVGKDFLEDLLKKGDDIAPMNTELRKLKDKIQGENSVYTNIILWGGLTVVLVVGGTQLSKWRGRKKIQRASGGARYDVEDREE